MHVFIVIYIFGEYNRWIDKNLGGYKIRMIDRGQFFRRNGERAGEATRVSLMSILGYMFWLFEEFP